ncbi:hypothetical protein F3Y22_tig00011718pilonHSYRG00208 [Hibiscus syriacus]|uniref:Agglutinin domain-containing protein n=1 Tax=Hibiscus syriacus TaxID=106335 RepID=A0A6A3C4Q8_HIBSY|nr:hypothetical protein F3Y22_tig00011718pilonHSYRG00208 [Hibiscus syriacus]
MAFASPKFIVLKSEKNNQYLSYDRDDSKVQLRCLEALALSTPFTKFEVVSSAQDGLVHIKNCRLNKYCERVKEPPVPHDPDNFYYAATADKPEEDQSKESCTLFKLVSVDIATNEIRIQHVQSGRYLGYCGTDGYPDYYPSDCLFTVSDWELLADWAFTSTRFIVLKYDANNEYLGFIREKGESYGYLKCSETRILSPYAKFEVEIAKSPGMDGLVHIRSCQNNKYWIAGGNSGITARAKEKEEDQSKESCTLFKLISVDDAASKVRIRHVQSKRYLRILDETWRVLAESEDFDDSSRDLFMIIDWDTPVVLPKFVAFKRTDDQYLCLRDIDGKPSLQFTSDDIGDSGVAMEIFMTNNGDIRIKPVSSSKFWRRGSDLVLVDSDYTSSINNTDTVFRPVKVNDNTIALLNLGNNKFCIRNAKTSCLSAEASSITKDAQLQVEEPVLGRKIYGIKYDLDNARIYDETVLYVARNSASNYTNQAETLDVRLSYTDIKTSTWMWQASLKLGAKATMGFDLPLIFEGSIELSGEIQGGKEWGETTTTSTVVELVHQVKVPPMTKVTVDLVAKKGKCDVPFTFLQKDCLYNGNGLVHEVPGNTYTGSNYYNTDFQTKEESLSSSI